MTVPAVFLRRRRDETLERMTEPVHIRRATPEDGAAVAPLLDQLGYPSTADEVRARLTIVLARPEYAAWVADLEGRAVGFAGAGVAYYFEREGAYGRLLALVVDAGARGAGAGAALLRAAEAWIAGRGGQAVIVNSGHQREAAHRFYERHGYAATGLRFVKTLPPRG
jgi:GNAT superfamily N-acetyltransferase